ncbi:hypothetical protein KSC_108400 [Ktedonobacter sp. SOSP1-52]|nr:hypothetical protein [Ktedonobacter sp. SOSP1-52]GHO71948.1 hypothetical protein KSC_108400 [Ktedonobacter sp. SOSP1-52]
MAVRRVYKRLVRALRACLTLPIYNSGDIGEQVGQMLFTPLASSQGVSIKTDNPLLQFMLTEADRPTIPA